MNPDTNDLTLPDKPLCLDGFGPGEPPFHVFEKKDIEAINSALAAGRPLLLRGEPGAGKSQLAKAAAKALGRAFVSTVVDARSEASDLMWTFDAVRRLADAQAMGAERIALRKEGKEDPLDTARYLEPGPLWWAFDWQEAKGQADLAHSTEPPHPDDCSPEHGVVVLLDEIDKADGSVPNGLLGCLGDGRFSVPGGGTVCRGEIEPLVVITTNEERSLPDAFLRRCLVHQLELPTDRQELFEWLMARGRAHFADLHDDVLSEAAEQTMKDRREIQRKRLAAPGCAEYLDLLRILQRRGRDKEHRIELLKVVKGFVLDKHPKHRREAMG